MAATLVLSVSYAGTNGSPTLGEPVTGIDLISADNATNSLTNRQNNPITVGTRSYEKWIRLKIATAPQNSVGNFKVWGDGAVDQSTTLWFTSGLSAYTVPISATSTVANVTFTQFTAGGVKATWDSASYFSTGSYTKYIVFQLQVGSDAGPGNWTQETVNYSYDET